jgi:hypothetical protein
MFKVVDNIRQIIYTQRTGKQTSEEQYKQFPDKKFEGL